MCHFFWCKYLTSKSCTCPTGATGMGSAAVGLAAGLVATLVAGVAALLAEGLARGLAAALGVGLAAGLAGDSSPCLHSQSTTGVANTTPNTGCATVHRHIHTRNQNLPLEVIKWRHFHH